MSILGSLLAMSASGFQVAQAVATPRTPQAPTDTILVIGDSLSAEYGLARGTGWVNLVSQRLKDSFPEYQIRNSSISGDTTSGGLSRLSTALIQYSPKWVLIELGANDALRGLSLDMTQKNLEHMVEQVKASGAQVILVGMQIPPNYGKTYTEQFQNLFPTIAEKTQSALVPFLLSGIETQADMFQADGLHPNETAQPVLANNVWAVLEPLLHKERAMQ